MALPTVYDICVPREDVLQGSITESDFAADLAQVLRGDAPEEYTDPVKFFANTYPTRGLKALLVNVCHRLNSSSKQLNIFKEKSGILLSYIYRMNHHVQMPD